jgi:hypothetical protein
MHHKNSLLAFDPVLCEHFLASRNANGSNKHQISTNLTAPKYSYCCTMSSALLTGLENQMQKILPAPTLSLIITSPPPQCTAHMIRPLLTYTELMYSMF